MANQMLDIKDDPALLRLLLDDMEKQEGIWKPTNFWKGYCARIMRELECNGLNGFRSNWNIIKGYEYTPVFRRDPFVEGRVGWVISRLLRIPLLNFVQEHYQRQGQRLINQIRERNQKLYTLVYYQLQQSEVLRNILQNVEDSEVGNPISFTVEGKRYTENILNQITAWGLLCESVDTSRIRSVLEIGGGYGAFAEIFGKLKKGELDYFVGIDIPPVLYVATQYLKAVFPGRVLDYSDLNNREELHLKDLHGKFVMLPPWCLSRLKFTFDLFWSIGAFQEMEKPVVDNYLKQVSKTCKCVFVSCLREGHAKGAGGQIEPITFSWIIEQIRQTGYDNQALKEDCVARTILNTIVPKYNFAYFAKP